MTTLTRRQALAKIFGEIADAALVTNLVNVRYLTGFTGSSGAVLVGSDGSTTLATDGRYAEQAAGQAPDVDIAVTRDLPLELMRKAGARQPVRVAVERHHVTADLFERLSAADGVEIVDLGHAVEELRAVKDDDELALLTRACAITDEVFDAVLRELRPGVTERDISWALRAALHSHGAEPSFESIVAFGPNSSRPHHDPTQRALERGDFVKLDFGAEVEGYHADMTRTVVVGAATDWQREQIGRASCRERV